MRLRYLHSALMCLLSISVTGCYPGAPSSWIPGTYHFSRSNYVTTLELRKDGTSVQTRQDPDGSSKITQGRWQVGPLDGHITIDRVIEFFPEPGLDMSKPGFYTPEVSIMWGKVCLLVDGNEDLYMCK
ncbi:hypothetical protein EDE15_4360 [Edaphobacter aggregans]|uniref:Uncharacterized protein n=1 Tax=Edaphobacter aggregans TaxID=570835 RepID=A0A428MPB9_9BACT|nr:hypothetical protein EDE15_4360 [Edaphobacter aggregans]